MQFIYQESTETVRIMPENYCLFTWSTGRPILDFDHAIPDNVLEKAILIKKDHVGVSPFEMVERLNETFSQAPAGDTVAEYVGDYRIRILKHKGVFSVVYGVQHTTHEEEVDAFKEFGYCVRHDMECRGLDPYGNEDQ